MNTKKIFYGLICIAFISILPMYSQGQFKIRNDAFIQIGYTSYKTLTFGQSTATPNNGNFAIEHVPTGSTTGLNFWKPWPTNNAGNYFLFIRDNNGSVGIGNNGDNNYKLNVSGSIRCLSLFTYSDEKLKTNFKSIDGSLKKLLAINCYMYNYIDYSEPIKQDSITININKPNAPYYFNDKQTHAGFKAQEFEKLFPDLTSTDENGLLSINYVELIPFLVSAIQEQNAIIEELKSKVEDLQRKK